VLRDINHITKCTSSDYLAFNANISFYFALASIRIICFMREMTDEILKQIDTRAMAIPIDMQDLCAKAEVAGSTISRWRAGARPRAKTLIKIYRALDDLEAR